MSLDPVRPGELRRLLAAANIRPNYKLGQNFLVDRHVLNRIIATAEIDEGDAVLEVGAGAGSLTRALAEAARKVVAIELDRRFQPVLEQVLGDRSSARVVFGDALVLDWQELLGDHQARWKVVANVPYYVTAPLLAKALATEPPFAKIVMMVQKEVAERLQAGPGSKQYGAISVMAAYYAQVRIAFYVGPGSFWPRPKVTSAVVLLTPLPKRDGRPAPTDFFPVVRAAFGRRRKTLRNAMSDDPHLGLKRLQAEAALARAGIEGERRGETLDVDDFARLAWAVAAIRRGEEQE